MLIALEKPSVTNRHFVKDKKEQFRGKVKELRKKMGRTQEDLVREIDVSLSTVQRWEGKGAKPTRHSRRELARLFREAGIDDV